MAKAKYNVGQVVVIRGGENSVTKALMLGSVHTVLTDDFLFVAFHDEDDPIHYAPDDVRPLTRRERGGV